MNGRSRSPAVLLLLLGACSAVTWATAIASTDRERRPYWQPTSPASRSRRVVRSRWPLRPSRAASTAATMAARRRANLAAGPSIAEHRDRSGRSGGPVCRQRRRRPHHPRWRTDMDRRSPAARGPVRPRSPPPGLSAAALEGVGAHAALEQRRRPVMGRARRASGRRAAHRRPRHRTSRSVQALCRVRCRSAPERRRWSDVRGTPDRPGGPRAHGLACDRQDADVVYMATASGDFYRSTSGGAFWTQLGDGLPDVAIQSLVAAGAPWRLYAVTDQGLFVSSNGGAHWHAADTDGRPGVASITHQLGIGPVVVAHPTKPLVAFAATTDGLLVTTDGGDHWTSRQAGPPRSRSAVSSSNPGRPRACSQRRAPGRWPRRMAMPGASCLRPPPRPVRIVPRSQLPVRPCDGPRQVDRSCCERVAARQPHRGTRQPVRRVRQRRAFRRPAHRGQRRLAHR